MTSTLQQINSDIDAHLQRYREKHPHYLELMHQILALPADSLMEKLGRDRKELAQIQRVALALEGCLQDGAERYFAEHPNAVSEMMAWSTNIFTLKHSFREEPLLDATQINILKLFAQDWDKNIMPALARRVEALGREKVAAGGIMQTLRECLPDAVIEILKAKEDQPALDPFTKTSMHLGRVLSVLQSININPAVNIHADNLIDALNDPWTAGTMSRLRHDAEAFATGFSTDQTQVNTEVVRNLKLELRGCIFDQNRSYLVAKQAVTDLRQRYWELAETPIFATRNVLAQENGGLAY